jgi:hypothetical protein
MRFTIVFLLINAGTMIAIDHGYGQAQILVANAISAGAVALLMSKMVIRDREEFETSMNKSPWLSGFICSGLAFLLLSLFNAEHYEVFLDYTLAIMVAPVFALIVFYTAHSRYVYIERKEKKKRLLREVSTTP